MKPTESNCKSETPTCSLTETDGIKLQVGDPDLQFDSVGFRTPTCSLTGTDGIKLQVGDHDLQFGNDYFVNTYSFVLLRGTTAVSKH